MSFPVRRQDAAPSLCARCGGETHCVDEEHVDDLFSIAVTRKFMWFSRCRSCGAVESRKSAKHRFAKQFPLTWKVRAYFLGTWTLVSAIVVTILLCVAWQERIERAHALSPLVGDQWTIETRVWPQGFASVGKYALVKVTSVSDSMIELRACDTTYDTTEDLRDYCEDHTFEVHVAGVERARLPQLHDDAIERVDSERDDHRSLTTGFGICAALIILWRIIGLAWKRRLAIADF
jgi:hypothetical protein